MTDTTHLQPVLTDQEARQTRSSALALRSPMTEEALEWKCIDGDCGHNLDGDCPSFELTVCAECYQLACLNDPEVISAEVRYPCATARALGVRGDS